MPFTSCLRLIFERGGFFGVPGAVRSNGPRVTTLPDGMMRPDHPVFADLAKDFEPFQEIFMTGKPDLAALF